MSKKITINQIEKVIELNKSGHMYNKISKEVGISISSISKILLTNNLKCNYKPVRKLNYEKILELANIGHSPIEISKKLNYNYSSVSYMLRLRGFKYRKCQGNVRYFQNIDSHKKAYFLGFIAADGCIQYANKNSKGLSITIHSKDRYILEELIKEIGCDKKLLEIKTKMSNSEKYKNHVRFALFNPSLYEDILSYGITERKSLTMPNIIPNIPKEFRKSFILGYFDGDGCVMNQSQSKYGLSIFIRGTYDFLKGIADELGINYYYIKFDKTHGISFSRKEEVIKLFDCYKNCNIFLQRKRDIFVNKISHDSWKRFIQVQTISSS